VDAPADVSTGTPLASWRKSNYEINAIVAAANGVITTACVHGRFDSKDSWQWFLQVLSKTDGSVMDSIHLPSEPLHQGLALTRSGNIVVSFKNGSVRSYGSPVSIASREPAMPAAPFVAPAVPALSTSARTAAPSQVHSHGDPTSAGPSTASVSPVTPAAVPTTVSTVSLVNSFDSRVSGGLRGVKDSVALTAANSDGRPASGDCTASYQPRDMRWQPERECLPIAAVKATSSASAMRPTNTVDRDLRTRWAPTGPGSQWLVYDLGRQQEVSAVTVVWYALKPCRTGLAVEVSADGKTFKEIDHGAINGRGINTTLRTFLPEHARYVRIAIDAPLSVYEVGIHGKAKVDAAVSLK
jgi:hypothetical protein